MWMSMNTTVWGTAHEATCCMSTMLLILIRLLQLFKVIALILTIRRLSYLNGTQVASSVATTNWDAFAAGAWVHVTVQKRQESLGLYRYEVFIGGNSKSAIRALLMLLSMMLLSVVLLVLQLQAILSVVTSMILCLMMMHLILALHILCQRLRLQLAHPILILH